MDLYAQNILDRYKEPFYKNKKVKADMVAKEANHSCGDHLDIQLEREEKIIKAYSFTGAGCAISQAAADILGDLIIGRTTDDILLMRKEELIEALGIEISERRMACALLALKAVQNALKKYDGKTH